MSRYGIIADPHGNEEALVACLSRLEAERVDRVICLGDLVGYNAGPNECVRRIVEARAVTIRGNHDVIALGDLGFDQCADKAAYALRRTRRDLSIWSRAYLYGLPAKRMLEGTILVIHGGLDDVQHYQRTAADIQGTAAALADRFPDVRLLFFAHTHEPRVYEIDGGRVREREPGAEVRLSRERLTFINPGSVDASRKRIGGRAELCVLDSVSWTVQFLRVRYDHAASEARAHAAGYRIPPLVARLYALQRRLRALRAAASRRLALSAS